MTFNNDNRDQDELSPVTEELEREVLRGAINGREDAIKFLKAHGIEPTVEETIIIMRRLDYAYRSRDNISQVNSTNLENSNQQHDSSSRVNSANLESSNQQYDSRIEDVLKPQVEKSISEDSSEASSSEEKQQSFWERGDRAIAFSAGGAFLGGLIAQIPGAIVGALAGAIFGWFEKSKPASSSKNSI